MKYKFLTIALCISTIAIAQGDYRTKAREYEERKAADKVNTERIHTQYTNNLPNERSSTSSGTNSDAQVKANAEAWWLKLKADLDALKSGPLAGTTGGGFTNEQRSEFAKTGNSRSYEVTYVETIISYYHNSLYAYIEKILAGNLPCETGDCQNGIGSGYIDNMEVSAYYKNGKIRDAAGIYINGDPVIKKITVPFKGDMIAGKGVVEYHDGTHENLSFTHNLLMGEATLKLPNKETLTYNFNHGKISGKVTHMASDHSNCTFLYRNDTMFTMLRSEHTNFTYPSEGMYTGKYYLYIKEETMTKLFKDEGDGAFYTGEYKKNSDTPNGFGTRAWADGDSFTGKISEGIAHGEGIFYFAEGDIYEGMMKNNNLQGFGTMSFMNGAYYKGNYKNGKRHGEGVHTYVNGYYIKGKFKDGYVHDVKYYNGNNEEITSDQYDEAAKD